jgi:hypothetical protein
MTSAKFRSSFFLLSLASLAGCGDGGFPDQPGESVITDQTKSFAVMSSGGGLMYPPPQGAACDVGIWTYTVHVDSAEFAWSTCDLKGDASDPAAYVPSSGSRVLPSDDLASVMTTARAVLVSSRRTCGADKNTLHMSVTSPSGSFVYGDDFYGCGNEPAYVDSQSLDNLVSVLRERYLGPVR